MVCHDICEFFIRFMFYKDEVKEEAPQNEVPSKNENYQIAFILNIFDHDLYSLLPHLP